VARKGPSDQRATGRAGAGGHRGVRETGSQAVDLALGYIKQETVEPVKGLGRFLVFGIAGSLAIALGSVFLLVAVLRLLQTETGAFHGNLSWIPYLVVIVLAAGIIALSAWRITAGPARRRRPPQPTEGE